MTRARTQTHSAHAHNRRARIFSPSDDDDNGRSHVDNLSSSEEEDGNEQAFCMEGGGGERPSTVARSKTLSVIHVEANRNSLHTLLPRTKH
jgi:hypothetical protein